MCRRAKTHPHSYAYLRDHTALSFPSHQSRGTRMTARDDCRDVIHRHLSENIQRQWCRTNGAITRLTTYVQAIKCSLTMLLMPKPPFPQTPRRPPDPSPSWLIRTELSCASKQQHGGLGSNWGDGGLHEVGMMIMQTWRQRQREGERESLLYLLVYNLSIKHIFLQSCTRGVMYATIIEEGW